VSFVPLQAKQTTTCYDSSNSPHQATAHYYAVPPLDSQQQQQKIILPAYVPIIPVQQAAVAKSVCQPPTKPQVKKRRRYHCDSDHEPQLSAEEPALENDRTASPKSACLPVQQVALPESTFLPIQHEARTNNLPIGKKFKFDCSVSGELVVLNANMRSSVLKQEGADFVEAGFGLLIQNNKEKAVVGVCTEVGSVRNTAVLDKFSDRGYKVHVGSPEARVAILCSSHFTRMEYKQLSGNKVDILVIAGKLQPAGSSCCVIAVYNRCTKKSQFSLNRSMS
jgi:hypothetical protein